MRSLASSRFNYGVLRRKMIRASLALDAKTGPMNQRPQRSISKLILAVFTYVVIILVAAFHRPHKVMDWVLVFLCSATLAVILFGPRPPENK